jgi:hypothetical protein
MAYIMSCDVCGGKVSSDAHRCPHCAAEDFSGIERRTSQSEIEATERFHMDQAKKYLPFHKVFSGRVTETNGRSIGIGVPNAFKIPTGSLNFFDRLFSSSYTCYLEGTISEENNTRSVNVGDLFRVKVAKIVKVDFLPYYRDSHPSKNSDDSFIVYVDFCFA